jgi:glycosyltransferase involved in cell wall biosynthesis
MDTPAVLHVLPSLGGGVDRHVRDIAAQVDRGHVLWHVGERAEVAERAGIRRYFPLDPARVDASPGALAAWLRGQGVGLVHLHGVTRAPRRRAELAARALGIPLLVTLHDVLFLRPDAFAFDAPAPDGPWVAEVAKTLRAARVVLAPSDYLAQLARRTFPGLEVAVVPNGLGASAAGSNAAPVARPEFLAHRPKRVVAVLGAIGAHKGADLLRELPAHLEGSGIGVVVIGYLDQQLYPGWNPRPHVYVHGPYQPEHTAALLAAYGAELVLFPNRVPESFSYALSEAWAAGVPVLAGPGGAIGERIARHGGGWLLAEGFDAASVAAELRRLLAPAPRSTPWGPAPRSTPWGPAAGEMARVRSSLLVPDASRVPTLSAMAETLDAYYRRYGVPPAGDAAGDPAAIDALLAPSLDSSLFRQELAHLADLCDQSGSDSKRARDFESEARRWIAKLEDDVRTLQEELAREFDERQRLARELAAAQAVAGVAARLPEFVKRVLARLARHARS